MDCHRRQRVCRCISLENTQVCDESRIPMDDYSRPLNLELVFHAKFRFDA